MTNSRMRLLGLTFFLIAAVRLWAAAEVPPARDAAGRIDRFVRDAMTRFPEVPSLGVAVVREGKPLLVRGYGLRDVERRLAASEDTVYYIASSTKSYVGLLAAVLAERGVVDLDIPVVRYMPELRFDESIDPERVTLRALLTHSAGLENDAIVARTAFTGEHTPAGLIALLGKSRAVEAGFRYGNLGYVAASLVLERVTGKRWQDLLASEILAPLGLRHTSAYVSRTARWPMAAAYDVGPDLRTRRMTSGKTDATMHAAGGLVSTPRDLALWLEANVSGGRIGNRQRLPAGAFREAQRNQVATPERTWYRFRRYGYALGWYHSDYEGATLLHHFGGYSGWRAHVSFLPKERHGVAITTNTSGPAAVLRDLIAAYAYDVMLGKPDVEAAYEVHLADLRKDVDADVTRMRAELEKRKQRAPSLLRQPSSYAGAYASDLYGMLRVREQNGMLRASLGPLEAPLEPFTEPDTARVELVPGSGDVLRFQFGESERAMSVKLRDGEFRRVEEN